MNAPTLRLPSILAPLVLASAALIMIPVYVATHGITTGPTAGEGGPARLFQLLLVAQLPFLGYAALQWLPRAPGRILRLLAIPVVLDVAAIALISYFEKMG